MPALALSVSLVRQGEVDSHPSIFFKLALTYGCPTSPFMTDQALFQGGGAQISGPSDAHEPRIPDGGAAPRDDRGEDVWVLWRVDSASNLSKW